PFLARGHRHAPERKARDEVGRPVQRIDDPDPRLVSGAAPASFFAQEAVPGEAIADPRRDDLLALLVRPGHEIVRLLLGDRAARKAPPVTLEDFASGARGVGRRLEDR